MVLKLLPPKAVFAQDSIMLRYRCLVAQTWPGPSGVVVDPVRALRRERSLEQAPRRCEIRASTTSAIRLSPEW